MKTIRKELRGGFLDELRTKLTGPSRHVSRVCHYQVKMAEHIGDMFIVSENFHKSSCIVFKSVSKATLRVFVYTRERWLFIARTRPHYFVAVD